MIKITSSSQLKKNKKFRLSIFKKPFCFKEKQKKYKLYEMPKFKSNFFKCKFGKKDIEEKILFISGPARSGNHLLLSMLDNHTQLANEVGEDDFLRTIFSYVNINEKKVVEKFKKGDINFILKCSGQPKLGRGQGIDKWKKLKEIFLSGKKSKIWSGSQPEGKAHITDFQGLVPNINYNAFKNHLIKNRNSIINAKNFLEIFQIYLNAKKKLIHNYKEKENKYKFKNRWTASGLRRELFYLLNKSKKVVSLVPIRKFENFYFSYAKTRHFTKKVNQKALNDLWGHWRHKVIDYLLLKKKYPKNIIIVKFEDIILNPEKTAKKISKKLNIKFNKSMLKTTVLGKDSLGNSSFKKQKNIKGKFYKTSINRKLDGVVMPFEYREIYKLINKLSI
jgi:hypothetical protein